MQGDCCHTCCRNESTTNVRVAHALSMRCEHWALSIRNVEKRGETWTEWTHCDAKRPSGQAQWIDESTNEWLLWFCGETMTLPWLRCSREMQLGQAVDPEVYYCLQKVFTCVYYHLTYHLLICRLSFVCEQRYKANERHAKHFCSMQMMEPMTDTLTFKHVLSKTASKTPIEFYRTYRKHRER